MKPAGHRNINTNYQDTPVTTNRIENQSTLDPLQYS